MIARRRLAAALVSSVLAAGCGGGDGARTPAPYAVDTPTSAAPGSSVPADSGPLKVKLTRVASLRQPVAMAVRAGDTALYVAEKGGVVRAVVDGTVRPEAVLDLGGEVSTGSEQGLLGLAFAPGAPARMYVNYTDRLGDTRVAEYGFAGGRADPGSRRELLKVDQPYANHNGGNLVFGPDGRLWIGLGDGGGQGDPEDNGQSLGTLLGKMLRIDPRPSGDRPYTVPDDNPFVSRAGARPEIWALGLRNPWRYSFDRETGDLWIGDVGGNAREEVDFAPAGSRGGENYGWDRLEGSLGRSGSGPEGAVGPLLEYDTGGSTCAVTGGYVYRGSRIPALRGAYLYGDFCAGQVQTVRRGAGGALDRRPLGVTVPSLASFGQDADGEIYTLSLAGALSRLDPA